MARLYRRRWTIERHFDLIKNALHGQVESLGQPRASIFALCLSMVASNALAVVKGAITTTHGKDETDKLSGYYLADEIAGNARAVDALVPPAEFDRLSGQSAKRFWSWCRSVARQIRPQAFSAHPRGPKRSPPNAPAANTATTTPLSDSSKKTNSDVERDGWQAIGATRGH